MFWKLEEARLRQYRTNASGVNVEELLLGYPGVPAGKVWVITALGYIPSAAETQVVSIMKLTTGGGYMSILNPIEVTLNPHYLTCIEQGMEYILFPGDYIRIVRGGHTVGSTMSGAMELIELDLPLYTYEEPQEVKRQKIALSSIRRVIGGGGGGRPGSMVGSAGRGTSGRGGGGAEPV